MNSELPKTIVVKTTDDRYYQVPANAFNGSELVDTLLEDTDAGDGAIVHQSVSSHGKKVRELKATTKTPPVQNYLNLQVSPRALEPLTQFAERGKWSASMSVEQILTTMLTSDYLLKNDTMYTLMTKFWTMRCDGIGGAQPRAWSHSVDLEDMRRELLTWLRVPETYRNLHEFHENERAQLQSSDWISGVAEPPPSGPFRNSMRVHLYRAMRMLWLHRLLYCTQHYRPTASTQRTYEMQTPWTSLVELRRAYSAIPDGVLRELLDFGVPSVLVRSTAHLGKLLYKQKRTRTSVHPCYYRFDASYQVSSDYDIDTVSYVRNTVECGWFARDWDLSAVPSLAEFFAGCTVHCTLAFWDVSEVKVFQNMFRSAILSPQTLESLATWNMRSATNVSGMLAGARLPDGSHGTLDVSRWNWANVTDVREVFRCAKLTIRGLTKALPTCKICPSAAKAVPPGEVSTQFLFVFRDTWEQNCVWHVIL